MSVIGPGQELPVTPSLRTPAGLELVTCRLVGRDQPRDGECEAEIRLETPDGSAVERGGVGHSADVLPDIWCTCRPMRTASIASS